MNPSDPVHGGGNESKVKGSGHRGAKACYSAAFVVLHNDIPLLTPIRCNKELNGIKRSTSSLSVRRFKVLFNVDVLSMPNNELQKG